MDNAAQSSMSASPVEYGTTLDRRPRTCWTVVSSNFKTAGRHPWRCRRTDRSRRAPASSSRHPRRSHSQHLRLRQCSLHDQRQRQVPRTRAQPRASPCQPPEFLAYPCSVFTSAGQTIFIQMTQTRRSAGFLVIPQYPCITSPAKRRKRRIAERLWPGCQPANRGMAFLTVAMSIRSHRRRRAGRIPAARHSRYACRFPSRGGKATT